LNIEKEIGLASGVKVRVMLAGKGLAASEKRNEPPKKIANKK
jgi:hypothetical protein